MATQKRRIVYLSDEEWDRILLASAVSKISASAYIRIALGRYQRWDQPGAKPEIALATVAFVKKDGRRQVVVTPTTDKERHATLRAAGMTQQAQRDAILRKINRGG